MAKELTKVSELIAEISMGPFGSDIKVENFVSSGVPVLNGSNLTKFRLVEDEFKYVTEEKASTYKKAIARKGDIVVTHRGTLGQISFIPDNSKYEYYVISQSQFRVRLKREKADPAFFVYYFHSPEGQKRIFAFKNHVGVPALAQATTNFRSIEIPLPDLPTQQKIAAVLSALDAKIELNQRINAELEAMAKTLYDYWFVQNARTGNWETGKLGDFIQVNERSITKDYPYKEIEYIDIASVSVGHLEGTTKYLLKDAPSRARRLVKHGDTIWSTVRPNRKSYLFICNPRENLVVSTGFAVLTPNKIPPSFLYFLTTTEQFVNYLVSNAEGSAYPAVSADKFAEIEFLIPPENKLAEFEIIVSPMLARISQNELESQTLTDLRDWLLPMLMNGQVTIKT